MLFFLPVDGSPNDGVSNLFGDTDDLVSYSHCCARVRSRLSPPFFVAHVLAGVWLDVKDLKHVTLAGGGLWVQNGCSVTHVIKRPVGRACLCLSRFCLPATNLTL